MEQDSGIEEVAGEGGRRISRRTLIKGSAVVGATVWAAPVVESFTSRAFAASATHYCCACANPVKGQKGTVDANQGEEDDSPPTESDCAQYCGGVTKGQTTKYDNFIWCGPSSILFNVGNITSAGYGCYHFDSQTNTNYVASGCTHGTVIYDSSGGYSTYETSPSTTSTSGVF